MVWVDFRLICIYYVKNEDSWYIEQSEVKLLPGKISCWSSPETARDLIVGSLKSSITIEAFLIIVFPQAGMDIFPSQFVIAMMTLIDNDLNGSKHVDSHHSKACASMTHFDGIFSSWPVIYIMRYWSTTDLIVFGLLSAGPSSSRGTSSSDSSHMSMSSEWYSTVTISSILLCCSVFLSPFSPKTLSKPGSLKVLNWKSHMSGHECLFVLDLCR